MSIAIQADSNLPQGYILVNGTAAATVRQNGTLVVPSLSANNVTGNLTGNVVGSVTGSLSGVASQATTLVTASASNAPVYGCRAWVNFDGTRNASGGSDTANTNRFIRSAGNVSSVLRTGLGNYTVTFNTAMPDSNYAINATGGDGISGLCNARANNSSSALVLCFDNNTETYQDSSSISIVVYSY